MVLTPVLEKRLLQTPVLHLAVVDILVWGHEGEVVKLAEKVVIPGQEDCLWHSCGDRFAILKPCDIDHWWGKLVDETDEDVGLSQFHRGVWEHSHFWRYWGQVTEISLPCLTLPSSLPPRLKKQSKLCPENLCHGLRYPALIPSPMNGNQHWGVRYPRTSFLAPPAWIQGNDFMRDCRC